MTEVAVIAGDYFMDISANTRGYFACAIQCAHRGEINGVVDCSCPSVHPV
jgi:hypothetical protein